MSTTALRTTTVRARVNPRLKRVAEAVLEQLGIGPSQAINMLYAQIALQKGLPFELRIPKPKTDLAMRHARHGRVRKAKNSAELFKELGI